jgi:RNA polymerase sigma factor (sigma-70 family)
VAALHALRDPERFSAWLYGIAANLARKWWERRARWPLSLDRLALTYPDVDWAPATVGGAPDLLAEAADEAARIRRALGALPAALRRVLVLHYLDGLSYAEIAAALDVPVSTVRGRLAASRSRLSYELAAAGATAVRRDGAPVAGRTHAHTTAQGQAYRRKEHAVHETVQETAVPGGPAGSGDDDGLVRVTVESIGTVDRAPTTENVANWLERLGSVPRGDTKDAGAPPDLQPVAARLAAALADLKLPVPWPSRSVYLKEAEGERRLWLVVGVAEADAMAISLLHQAPPRPLTHDLAGNLLAAAGQQVTRAVITRLEGSTFFATVAVQGRRGRAREVDARPSDAICLALRAGAPIYVAESLLARVGPGFIRPEPEGNRGAVARLAAAALTLPAERALDLMRQEAADLGHHYLGTEHLLLGLLGAGGSAAVILVRHGVDAAGTRERLAAWVGRARVLVGEAFRIEPGHGTATPRLEAMYDRALEAAAGRSQEWVGTLLLLLGLVGDETSLAAGLLQAAGVEVARMKEVAVAALESAGDPEG